MKNLVLLLVLLAVAGMAFLSFSSTKLSKKSYETFNVLIVPGHEPKEGGAYFGELFERNLNVILGAKISKILEKKSGYTVMMARDNEAWHPRLSEYFLDKKPAILDFKNNHKLRQKILASLGLWKIKASAMPHADLDGDSAVLLYGLNRWANENDVDLVLHIHFNDSARKDVNLPGFNKGFTMFVPDSQLENAGASREVGQMIYDKLKANFKPQLSSQGELPLLEDQSLIALGAYNTLLKPSILIEYAYIYEDMLQNESSREYALEIMAKSTASGIQEYFKENK